MNAPARPTEVVPQHIHDAALIVAGSDLCLDGDRTDLTGILRTLDHAGLRFNEGDLNTVIERARLERAAWAAAKGMGGRYAAL